MSNGQRLPAQVWGGKKKNNYVLQNEGWITTDADQKGEKKNNKVGTTPKGKGT